MAFLILCRRRPTLPHTFACSTIGPAGLNFRVRDGNGWIPRGKITDKIAVVGHWSYVVGLFVPTQRPSPMQTTNFQRS
jgi:hypothetical protein